MSAPGPMLPPNLPGFGFSGAPGVGGTQTVVVYNITVPAPPPKNVRSFAFCCSSAVLRPFLVVLLWAGWVIYIAGTSKLQNLCNSGYLVPGVPLLDDFDKAAIVVLQQPMTSGGCVAYFGLLWWSVWLQFTTLLILTATGLTMYLGLPYTKPFLHTALYFFIMSTILLFFQANDYQTANYLFRKGFYDGDNESDWQTACTLTTVGAILSLIFNFIYIIWNTHAETGSSSTGLPGPMMMGGPPHMGPPPPGVDGDAFIVPGEHKTKLVAAAPTTGAVPPTTTPHHAAPEAELASTRLPSTTAPPLAVEAAKSAVQKSGTSATAPPPAAAEALKPTVEKPAASGTSPPPATAEPAKPVTGAS